MDHEKCVLYSRPFSNGFFYSSQFFASCVSSAFLKSLDWKTARIQTKWGERRIPRDPGHELESDFGWSPFIKDAVNAGEIFGWAGGYMWWMLSSPLQRAQHGTHPLWGHQAAWVAVTQVLPLGVSRVVYISPWLPLPFTGSVTPTSVFSVCHFSSLYDLDMAYSETVRATLLIG